MDIIRVVKSEESKNYFVMHKPLKEKVVVIREGYFIITGKDTRAALILGQMDYWTQRKSDFNEMLKEEIAAQGVEEPNIQPSSGWIYKTAAQLTEEVMGDWTDDTTRASLKKLVSLGYLSERNNPYLKWDRTIQYHFNAAKVAEDLHNIGYTLLWYNTYADTTNSDCKPNVSASKDKASGAIPETTTEINTLEIAKAITKNGDEAKDGVGEQTSSTLENGRDVLKENRGNDVQGNIVSEEEDIVEDVLKEGTKDTQAVKMTKKNRTITSNQKIYSAIAQVTGLDGRLRASRGRIGKVSASLAENGYTPETILTLYSKGNWWYKQDWRGKQGQQPTPEQIEETIGRAAQAPDVPVISANASGHYEEHDDKFLGKYSVWVPDKEK